MASNTPRGWRPDPGWRKARASKAGAASGKIRQARLTESLAGWSKAECYRRGYLNGYVRGRRRAGRRDEAA